MLPSLIHTLYPRIRVPGAVAPVSILVHPASQTVNLGSTMTLSVSDVGNRPAYYQWQVDTGGGFVNVTGGSGANTPTYVTPTLVEADDGNLYRVLIVNAGGTTISNVATLTLASLPVQQVAARFQGNADGLTSLAEIADAGITNYTIEMLCRIVAETNNAQLFTLPNTGNGRTVFLQYNGSSQLTLGDSQSGSIVFTTDPPVNTWLLVTLSSDPSNSRQLRATWARCNPDQPSTVTTMTRANGIEPSVLPTTFRINGGAVATGFASGLDVQYVRAYDNYRSDAQIITDRQLADPTGCLFWWKFADDGGGGVTVTDEGPIGTFTPTTMVGAALVTDGPVVPNVSDPAPPESTVPPLASAHPYVYLNDAATVTRLQTSLTNNDAPAVRFRNMVNNELAAPGTNYAFNAWNAALMYRLTGTTSYGTFAVNMVETFVAAEEARIAANTMPVIAGDVYLEVGPILKNVCLVFDWCYSLLTAGQRTRWINYANQACFNLQFPSQAEWGGNPWPWNGWSVNNPANNYYYSHLEAFMYNGLGTYGDNPQAQNWMNRFRLIKLRDQAFPYFDAELVGGGSREGTGYGTAVRSLLGLYDWWEKSTGERIADLTTHTLSSFYWTMHTIVPTLNFIVHTGDHARDATGALYDYHREYLQNMIALYPAQTIAGAAKTLLANSSVTQMAQSLSFFNDFINFFPAIAAQPLTTLYPTYYGSGTGNVFMRSSWTDTAALVHFMCGPFTESHAHQDQGSILLYCRSWLGVDANSRSASGINFEVILHNLVRIEASGSVIGQTAYQNPSILYALHDETLYSYTGGNILPIYNGDPRITKVEREIVLHKAKKVAVIVDRVNTSGAGLSRIFGFNSYVNPSVVGDVTTITNSPGTLVLHRLAPTGITATSGPVGGGYTNVWRTDAAHNVGNESVFLHVAVMDGGVSTVTRIDEGGIIGAQILYSDGTELQVRFSIAGRGGSILIEDASNVALVNEALSPTTIASLPLLA